MDLNCILDNAKKQLMESLELAKLACEGDLFNQDNATEAHKAIVAALNNIKVIERMNRALSAIMAAQGK